MATTPAVVAFQGDRGIYPRQTKGGAMPTDLTPRERRGLPWGSDLVRDLAGDRYAKGRASGFHKAGTSREAMVQAGLDWDVTLGPLYVMHLSPGGVSRIEVPERLAVQRTDNGWPVGVVGERYHPLNNRAQAEFTDLLLDTHSAKLAGMGATKDGGMGTRVYTVVEVDGDLRPGGMADEQLRVFLITSNAFDGSTAFTATLGAWRMVCANTLHYNVHDLTTSWQVRHVASMKERLVLAQDAIRKAAGWGEALVLDAEEMLRVPVSLATGVDALETILPVPAEKVGDDGTIENERAIKRAEDRLVAVEQLWRHSDDLADIRDTGYGLFNAVAEYQSWGRATRSDAMTRFLGRPKTGDPVLVRARRVVQEMAR